MQERRSTSPAVGHAAQVEGVGDGPVSLFLYMSPMNTTRPSKQRDGMSMCVAPETECWYIDSDKRPWKPGGSCVTNV